ncbi:ribosome production factor 1 [Hyalella azteca]|uniref:Ribosome production factor 1 n=1 Tax=Hyalella azteca TaxID=294128 RepID=A0A8B7PG02_HYAAZ|nr:ribosome production factor 1 [Hyalella azteca]
MKSIEEINHIKNKENRRKLYKKYLRIKRRERRKAEFLKRKVVAEQGPDAWPTKPVRSIEGEREDEETAVHDAQEEEIVIEEAIDTYKEYYQKEAKPKVLLACTSRPHSRTITFLKELKRVIPNSYVKWKANAKIKQLGIAAHLRGFTDIIVINEDNKKPNSLLLTHLPEGPTAYFRLSGVKVCKELRKDPNDIMKMRPEVLLNHFTTRLGRQVSRMLGAVFHYSPNFKGRRVCTFHNQRDFIFFRNHLYQFRSEEKVGLRELGPRFTLKLMWLQEGVMEGDYEWVYKPREQETSRTRFVL